MRSAELENRLEDLVSQRDRLDEEISMIQAELVAVVELDGQGSLCRHLLNTVCQLYGLSCRILRSRSRKNHISEARQLVWYVLRDYGWSFQQIGKAFGRDHTSVMHGVKRIQGRLSYEPSLKTILERVRAHELR